MGALMTRAKWIAMAVLLVLQVADVATTLAVFHVGGIELNPLVRGLGLLPAKLIACAAVCLLVWATKHPRWLWIMCGVYGMIVGWNASLVLFS